jgi:glycerol transport system substrate-binding protein
LTAAKPPGSSRSSALAKTISLKKTHVGLTPIRDSDIRHASFTERAPKLGGLVEFYRSPARVAWTPTGTNVPDYPKLAQLWWQNIGEAVSGEVTVSTAMDNLAKEQDRILERIERSKVQGDKGPETEQKKRSRILAESARFPQGQTGQ